MSDDRVNSVPDDLPECTPEEHDAWFRAEVQKALDDPRPGIPDEDVNHEMRARISRLRSKAMKSSQRRAQG